MGLEPTNLLTASQALYQLSYAPEGDRHVSSDASPRRTGRLPRRTGCFLAGRAPLGQTGVPSPGRLGAVSDRSDQRPTRP